MAKKSKNKYTTIQISSEVNEHIRTLCDRYGLRAATVTERYWASLISASMSGSISLQG
jgi:hypothetical protein